MKLIKVKYTGDEPEILECGDNMFLEDGKLPKVFIRNLKTFSLTRCESIVFKHNIGNDIFRITIKGEHGVYLFTISLITNLKKTSDTDQMLEVISKKYLSEDEITEDNSQMLLSIYLELRKLKVDFESKNHSLLDRMQTSEEYLSKRLEEWKELLEERLTCDYLHKEEIEEKLEEEYLKKEYFTLSHLIVKSTKKDLVLLCFALIILASFVDAINIKKFANELIEKPIELIK